jgi:hypothetical protein
VACVYEEILDRSSLRVTLQNVLFKTFKDMRERTRLRHSSRLRSQKSPDKGIWQEYHSPVCLLLPCILVLSIAPAAQKILNIKYLPFQKEKNPEIVLTVSEM